MTPRKTPLLLENSRCPRCGVKGHVSICERCRQLSRVPEQPWRQRGACVPPDDADPEVVRDMREKFFPLRGQSPEPAKKVCARCEVRLDCLEYALEVCELDGIWGGKTPTERRALRKRLRRG